MHDTMVSNILDAYNGATESQRARGAGWYPEYRDRLAQHATETQTPMHRALGIVAISSINTRPEPGLAWSRRVMDGETGGHLPIACDRAARILRDAQDFEHARDLACSPESPSRKVRNFACNVATGGRRCNHDVACATIDRWALYVATAGEDKRTPNGRKYDRVASAYRAAADVVGIPPAILQAIVWVTVAE